MGRSGRLGTVFLVAVALGGGTVLSGCAAPLEEMAAAVLPDAPGDVASRFRSPLQLNGDGFGYEPGVEVAPDGTIFATARKASNTNEGTQLASWLWFSRDGGASWSTLTSPAQAHERLPSKEGDVAVDALGRLYFVDTYTADTFFSRWAPSPEGPRWESTRPLHGTTGVDDRPWLSAHGDGTVYYLANNGPAMPAPESALEEPGTTGRFWFYVSEDAGETWSLGRTFPDADRCAVAASKADDRTVYVGCDEIPFVEALAGLAPAPRAVMFASSDRGRTWTKAGIAAFGGPQGELFPSTATDLAGNAYHVWVEEPASAGASGLVRLARSLAGGAWEVVPVPLFAGRFAMPWVSGGEAGTVAISFYAARNPSSGGETAWGAYLLLSTTADARTLSWELIELDPEPSGRAERPPGEFFQNAIGPRNEVHVIYQRERPDADAPTAGYPNDILYTVQDAGPNLHST